jgi:hypothetical protein
VSADRVRVWAAIALFGAAWILARMLLEVDVRFSDVPLYRRYGEAVIDGDVPYRDFALEYPPGALPVFVLPALVSSDLAGFRIALELLLAACGVGMLGAMHTLLVRLRAPAATSWLALLLVATSPLLLGRLTAERYDLWPAALAAAALAAAVWGRHRTAGALLALGTAAKFFPIVLLPLLGWWAWRRHGRRAALHHFAAFAVVALVCVLPFVAASASGMGAMLERQVERPLQIETVGSALLLALHHAFGLSLGVEASYGSINLGGTKADVVAGAQSLLLLVLLVFVWVGVARRRSPDAETLVLASALAVTAVVVLGKVLSPQFLVWLLPFVPLVGGRKGVAASALLAAACVATQLVFPSRYLDLIRLDETASVLVIARDLVLVAILGMLVHGLRARTTAQREEGDAADRPA